MPKIVMCGIPRSGSTLVWQILQSVFPGQSILQTHPQDWEPDGSVAVVTIRDPRDIAASLLRVRLSRAQRDEMLLTDVENVLARVDWYFGNGLKKVTSGPCILFRYEEFFNNYSLIYDVIESNFGVMIPETKRKELSGKFSLESNRARADKMLNFNEVGEDQIHGDHIGHVNPGYWIDYLPVWSLDLVREICEPICRKWGYG